MAISIVKSYDYFKPEMIGREPVNIIGCGAVGSTVAEMLTRFGVKHFVLWDFDKVEAHNVANQMFGETQIGLTKIDALSAILRNINTDIDIKTHPDGWNGERLSGYVILAVDNIEIRKRICEEQKTNSNIIAVFDFRMRMLDGQHYAADWANPQHKNALLRSMEFSHDEAAAATPRSACNYELSVVTSLRMLCAVGVQNIINFIRTDGAEMYKVILTDISTMNIESYK